MNYNHTNNLLFNDDIVLKTFYKIKVTIQELDLNIIKIIQLWIIYNYIKMNFKNKNC